MANHTSGPLFWIAFLTHIGLEWGPPMSTQAAKLARDKSACFSPRLPVRPLLAFLVLMALCAVPQSTPAADPPFTDANWVSLPGANAEVDALELDTNGNLYVGGLFTNVGGVDANHIAEWNGVTWMPLGSGINGLVTSLAFDTSGNLYAGGNFTMAGGVSANYIARWDGTNWSGLSSGMSGQSSQFGLTVYALAGDGSGSLYAGGSFTNAGGTSATAVAKWNGSAWSALGSGMNNGAVFALACDASGNLYAGGKFQNAGDVSANNVARWGGSEWSALGSGMATRINALCTDGSGNLYLGANTTGNGDGAPPTIAKWNGLGWSTLSLDGNTTSLAYHSPNLYAGGFSGQASIAAWNGSTGFPLGSGIGGGISAEVLGLAIDNSGNLYVGGMFNTAGTNAAVNIAKALLSGPTPNQLTLAQTGPATNVITYLGTPGDSYALDLATDLNPPINWFPQTTNVTSTNNATTAGYLTVTNFSSASQGFYRVRSVP